MVYWLTYGTVLLIFENREEFKSPMSINHCLVHKACNSVRGEG